MFVTSVSGHAVGAGCPEAPLQNRSEGKLMIGLVSLRRAAVST